MYLQVISKIVQHSNSLFLGFKSKILRSFKWLIFVLNINSHNDVNDLLTQYKSYTMREIRGGEGDKERAREIKRVWEGD